jgi:hypothetical protein
LLQLLKRLFSRKKLLKPGRVCFSITSTYVSFAYLIPSEEGALPSLQACRIETRKEELPLKNQLRALLESEHLDNVRCSLLLAPGEAVPTKLHDVLFFLDLKQAGFLIDSVVGFESALQNVLHAYAPHEKFLALLSFEGHHPLLMVSKLGDLTHLKLITIDLEALHELDLSEQDDDEPVTNPIFLDLRTNIESCLASFYEQNPAVIFNQLIFHYEGENYFELGPLLSKSLSIKLQALDFARLVRFTGDTDYQALSENLAVIGGAM